MAAEPQKLELAPYGALRLLAVRSPDGAWLEFFEELSAGPAELSWRLPPRARSVPAPAPAP